MRTLRRTSWPRSACEPWCAPTRSSSQARSAPGSPSCCAARWRTSGGRQAGSAASCGSPKPNWTTLVAGPSRSFPPERAARTTPRLHDIAARGRRIDILAQHRALSQRLRITDAAHAFIHRLDLVLGPVMHGPAFAPVSEAPQAEAPDDRGWFPHAPASNMTGQPALAAPGGFTPNGCWRARSWPA
jgi:Asp-tRNA(Asn)/Glu-tRNA(Gln) amidotransferase A subunit family amidase